MTRTKESDTTTNRTQESPYMCDYLQTEAGLPITTEAEINIEANLLYTDRDRESDSTTTWS